MRRTVIVCTGIFLAFAVPVHAQEKPPVNATTENSLKFMTPELFDKIVAAHERRQRAEKKCGSHFSEENLKKIEDAGAPVVAALEKHGYGNGKSFEEAYRSLNPEDAEMVGTGLLNVADIKLQMVLNGDLFRYLHCTMKAK